MTRKAIGRRELPNRPMGRSGRWNDERSLTMKSPAVEYSDWQVPPLRSHGAAHSLQHFTLRPIPMPADDDYLNGAALPGLSHCGIQKRLPHRQPFVWTGHTEVVDRASQ